ncbi:MAG: LysR family transcriptional regulator [Pseudomonadota bacterium]
MDLFKAINTTLRVVDTGSLSAASRELNIAVSAISRQVSELEKHFDCTLLYRTTRTMKLTPEGEFFVAKFRQILGHVDELQDSLAERRQRVEGKLRITSPQNIGQMGINPHVASFMQKHPKVELSWMMVNRYVNLIEEGFDLAIRAGELDDSTFVSRRYGRFQMEFAASPEYLEKAGLPTHPRELVTHQCLLDSSLAQPGRIRYQENTEQKQVNVSGSFTLNQGHLLADFARLGLGVCHLPDFLLEGAKTRGELVPILEEYWQAPIDIFFVYPASKLTNTVVRAFIDHLLVHQPFIKNDVK